MAEKTGANLLLSQAIKDDPPRIAPHNQAQADFFCIEEDEDGIWQPKQAGAGRPRGSQNKDTAEFAKILSKRYGKDPMDYLWSLIAMSPTGASKMLGVDILEAVKLQIKAAGLILPYGHKPQRPDIDQGGYVTIAFPVSPDAAPLDAAQASDGGTIIFGFDDDAEVVSNVE